MEMLYLACTLPQNGLSSVGANLPLNLYFKHLSCNLAYLLFELDLKCFQRWHMPYSKPCSMKGELYIKPCICV